VLLDTIPLFLLALILGFKHAYDADHIIAVSTYLPKSRSLKETFQMSLSWAIGHMTTAGIVTFLLFIYKDIFLSKLLVYFEPIVGVMLIILGLASVFSSRGVEVFHHHINGEAHRGHEHPHIHDEGEVHIHYHKHMFGIGIVHGLASNDELIVLFTASLGVASLTALIAYVAIYTIGVVAGMVAFGYALSYTLVKAQKEKITKTAMLLIGLVSIVYGALLLVEAFGLS
jgi:high-affinity nickel permease